MMRKSFIECFAAGASLLLFTFCSKSPNDGAFSRSYFIDNDSIPSLSFDEIEVGAIMNYSDIYDSISLIKLETNPESLIGSVSKVEVLKNGEFLIFDNTNAGVFVFSPEGTFMNCIGHRGNGEKEYITPEDVAYDSYNDEVIVWDHNKMCLMFYKTDGKYIRKIRLPWHIGSLHVLDKEHIAVFMNHRDDLSHGTGCNIKALNRNGALVHEDLPFSETFVNFNPACKLTFSVYKNTLYCTPPYSSRDVL